MRLFRTLGQKSGVRNHSTLDITRLSMERYLQEIIENKNVLEGQEMPLKRFFEVKRCYNRNCCLNYSVPTYIFYKYQNNNVKHDNNVKKEDIDYFLDVACNY